MADTSVYAVDMDLSKLIECQDILSEISENLRKAQEELETSQSVFKQLLNTLNKGFVKMGKVLNTFLVKPLKTAFGWMKNIILGAGALAASFFVASQGSITRERTLKDWNTSEARRGGWKYAQAQMGLDESELNLGALQQAINNPERWGTLVTASGVGHGQLKGLSGEQAMFKVIEGVMNRVQGDGPIAPAIAQAIQDILGVDVTTHYGRKVFSSGFQNQFKQFFAEGTERRRSFHNRHLVEAERALNRLNDEFKVFYLSIASAVTPALSKLLNKLTSLLPKIRPVFEKVLAFLGDKLESGLDWVSKIDMDKIANTLTKAFESIVEYATRAWEIFKSIIEALESLGLFQSAKEKQDARNQKQAMASAQDEWSAWRKGDDTKGPTSLLIRKHLMKEKLGQGDEDSLKRHLTNEASVARMTKALEKMNIELKVTIDSEGNPVSKLARLKGGR